MLANLWGSAVVLVPAARRWARSPLPFVSFQGSAATATIRHCCCHHSSRLLLTTKHHDCYRHHASTLPTILTLPLLPARYLPYNQLKDAIKDVTAAQKRVEEIDPQSGGGGANMSEQALQFLQDKERDNVHELVKKIRATLDE